MHIKFGLEYQVSGSMLFGQKRTPFLERQRIIIIANSLQEARSKGDGFMKRKNENCKYFFSHIKQLNEYEVKLYMSAYKERYGEV